MELHLSLKILHIWLDLHLESLQVLTSQFVFINLLVKINNKKVHLLVVYGINYSSFSSNFRPNVWVQILGNEKAIFLMLTLHYSLLRLPLFRWFFSIIDNSKRATTERAMFRAQNVRANTGIGSAGAVSH